MKITRRVALSAPVLLAIVLLVVCDRVRTAYARSSSSPRATVATVRNDTEFLVADTAVNCKRVKPFFDSKNITLLPADERSARDPLKTTCGGKCCGAEMEKRLRQQARADFHSLIHHHSRSLQGLLATTAESLRETVILLARQSENKTLTLFDQVYRSMTVLTRPSIKALYQAMVNYVSSANTLDSLQQPMSREMLEERFTEFFTRLFPIAYHHIINPRQDKQDFTDKFKGCLYDTMADIEPFGSVPQRISHSVSKGLEANRVLMQALTLGKNVLDKTDSVLFASGTNSPHQESCDSALVRMTYCPRCKGIGDAVSPLPCNGLCINVMRGCLTEPASELDLAWSGYVEKVDRLVVAVDGHNDDFSLNAEETFKKLDGRISEAIMHAMENGPLLEEKVRNVCGRWEVMPSSEERSSASSNAAAAAKSTASLGNDDDDDDDDDDGKIRAAASSPSHGGLAHRGHSMQLHVQLGNFLASVDRSRNFYGTLADAICEDYPHKHCWNGERIGEYAKTVVDSSLTAQRYNPEFTITTMSTPASYDNANISALIDQLRHINQMIQSQLASAPDAGAFLGDEALDGSGSGDTPYWRSHVNGGIDDEEGDQGDDEEASGSGMGPTTTESTVKIRQNGPIDRGGSSTVLLSSVVLAIVCAPLVA